MSATDILKLILDAIGVISSGGFAIALLSYRASNAKLRQEIENLKAEAEKIKAEGRKVGTEEEVESFNAQVEGIKSLSSIYEIRIKASTDAVQLRDLEIKQLKEENEKLRLENVNLRIELQNKNKPILSST